MGTPVSVSKNDFVYPEFSDNSPENDDDYKIEECKYGCYDFDKFTGWMTKDEIEKFESFF